jgi:hypothetical protein
VIKSSGSMALFSATPRLRLRPDGAGTVRTARPESAGAFFVSTRQTRRADPSQTQTNTATKDRTTPATTPRSLVRQVVRSGRGRF